MPKSMTGFGSAEVQTGDYAVQVDIKSINSKYCDINIRLPKNLMPIEPVLRKKISANITRGKIDIYINFTDRRETGVKIIPNLNLARAYAVAINQIAEAINDPGISKVRDVIKMDGIFSVEDNNDIEAVNDILLRTLDQAINNIIKSKLEEGEHLAVEVINYIDQLQEKRRFISDRMPEIVDAYRIHLENKLKEILTERTIDETRIIMETAILADKFDVSEEMVRLNSHLDLLRNTIVQDGAVGKKLDFIIQEINREINTTGSKVNNSDITKCVVEMKCISEKIREQIQNIE